MRPKFNKYHSGDWPYDEEAGVGLVLKGRPTDYAVFIDVLQGEGCPLVAALRILEGLESKGRWCTTVDARLNFDNIGSALAALGVTMTVTAPQANLSTQHYDNAVLQLMRKKNPCLDKFSEQENAHIQSSLQNTLAWLDRLPSAASHL